MVKISYSGCIGLPRVISVQFTLEMCVAAGFSTGTWHQDRRTGGRMDRI